MAQIVIKEPKGSKTRKWAALGRYKPYGQSTGSTKLERKASCRFPALG
jgi:hypothetical protein